MGLDTRRPPLPAPTDDPDVMDHEMDMATDISRRTDRTSYSIPEDGSPITISTTKLVDDDGHRLGHGRHKSQASLLIEYFEASKDGDKSRSKPSLRVKVTPSNARKTRGGHDAVQITGIGNDRKPSYTRRISLGRNEPGEKVIIDGTDISRSDESTISRPPVEVEVLDPNASDLSTSRVSRDLCYITHASDISSLVPDSFLDTSASQMVTTERHSKSKARDRSTSIEHKTATATHLDAPDDLAARSLSRDRITQKVMEKLTGRPAELPRKNHAVEYEPDTKPTKERRRRHSSRSQHSEDFTSPVSSIISSGITASQTSHRSANSKVSLNNPKLLEMVEDTVKRLILPELHEMRKEQKASRNLDQFERRTSITHEDVDDLERTLSKSSSTPNIRSKPKVVLNRYDDHPGEVLSRGDSERRTSRGSYRDESTTRDRHSSRHVSEARETRIDRDGSHGIRDAALGLLAGGAAATATHKVNKRDKSRSRNNKGRRVSISHDIKDDERRDRDDLSTLSEEHLHTKEFATRPDIHRQGSTDTVSILESARQAHDEHYTSLERESRPMNFERYPRERLPFHGGATESDLTRASIRSASTEKVDSFERADVLATDDLRRGHGALSYRDDKYSPRSTDTVLHGRKSTSLTEGAAAIGGAALAHRLLSRESHDDSTAVKHSQNLDMSEHVSSREDLADPLIPDPLKPRTPLSVHETRSVSSRSSMRAHSRLDDSPLVPIVHETESPKGKARLAVVTDDLLDTKSRRVSDSSSNRRSGGEKRLTDYTADSMSTTGTDREDVDRDVRQVINKPPFIHHRDGIESAVASVINPSTTSSQESYVEEHTDRPPTITDSLVNERIDDVDHFSPSAHELELAQAMPLIPSRPTTVRTSSKSRSTSRSMRGERATDHVVTEEHEIRADHPSPRADMLDEHGDIQMLDATSRHDRLSDDRLYRGSEEIEHSRSSREDNESITERESHELLHKSSRPSDKSLAALELASGAFAAVAALKHHSSRGSREADLSPIRITESRHTTVEDVVDETFDNAKVQNAHHNTPPHTRMSPDEGYSSASKIVETPHTTGRLRRVDSDYASYKSVHSVKTSVREQRSGSLGETAHSAQSPFSDGAASTDIDKIQSADVVALMEHLTVRDGQRNARDTEILMTLVRSATELRQNFDELKRFIKEEDRMIMQNADRNADVTNKNIIQARTAQPSVAQSSRSPRTSFQSDSISEKRPKFFKRALRGLKGRNSNDLARMEDMLMQLLDEVEELKEAQMAKVEVQAAERPKTTERTSMSSYEAMRARDLDDDYDYLREDDTTPTQFDFKSPTRTKHVFHSGYDGRPDSLNRASTIMEGDEESERSREEQLTPKPLASQMWHGSPRADERRQGIMFSSTPPLAHHSRNVSLEESTPSKHRKHRSNGSSILSNEPKVSRWSKTTDSSLDRDQEHRLSYMSLSDEHLQYSPERRVSSSSHGSTSPLSEPDPQYQGIRNSLVLEHPQPRQGATDRHQTTLESRAQEQAFDPASLTNSDVNPSLLTGSDLSTRTVDEDSDPMHWGTNPGLSLARAKKLGHILPATMEEDGPLIPDHPAVVRKPVASSATTSGPAHASGDEAEGKKPKRFDRQYYNSPLGSGHLLEPIEECRYSLETERTLSPAKAERAADRGKSRQEGDGERGERELTPRRTLTGPRPMKGGRSPRSPSANA